MFLARGRVFSHEAVRDWAARCAPLLAARLRAKRRGQAGSTWHADETDVKGNGAWWYFYRAIDRAGHLVEALLREQRDMAAAQQCCAAALAATGHAPTHVTTDGHDAYPRALRETLGDGVFHRTSRDNNKRIEQDIGVSSSATTPCAASAASRRLHASAPASRSSASISAMPAGSASTSRSRNNGAFSRTAGLPFSGSWRLPDGYSVHFASPVATFGAAHVPFLTQPSAWPAGAPST